MAKPKWSYEVTIGDRRVYARMTRREIEVRVEHVGDVTKYALYGYPKVLGIPAAARLAAREVPDSKIKE